MWPCHIEAAWIEPGAKVPSVAIWHRQASPKGVRTERDHVLLAHHRRIDLPTGSHVLLAEDDGHMRVLVAEALRDDGYEVEEASDGRDALTAIRRARPLLLITDCNMPNMTGNELVETLMHDDGLRSIPVIVISALIQPAFPANVLVFLAKPFTLQALHAAVRGCLTRA